MDEFIEGIEQEALRSTIRRVVAGAPVTIVVKRCDVIGGLKHARLQREGVGSDELDPDRRTARIVLYPACVAATESMQGLEWPMSFDTFAGLEDVFASEWLAEVFRLNPVWLGEGGEEEKKSAPTTPTSG